MVLGLGGGAGDEKSGITGAKLGDGLAQASGLGSGLAEEKGSSIEKPETEKEKLKLVNRAKESKSPYVSCISLLLGD